MITKTLASIWVSDAIETADIVQDLSIVLKAFEEKLALSNQPIQQAIISVDGTNFSVTFSGFIADEHEYIAETSCSLNLAHLGDELYKEGFGSDDFEYDAKQGLNILLKSDNGQRLLSTLEMYIENDMGEIKKINSK